MKCSLPKCIAGLLGVLIVSSHLSAKETNNITFKAEKVANTIYMIHGEGGFAGGNIGLTVGEDGAILIDGSMPPLFDKVKNTILSITDKQIKFLVNTHVHGDHIANNSHYHGLGAHIVAHENLRKQLVETGMPTLNGVVKPTKEAIPTLTYKTQLSFHLNDTLAQVVHAEAAHTSGDSYVFFPNENVLHTGDLFFNGLFPFIDANSGGGILGYIKAQKSMLALIDEKTKIIPGHGPLAIKADLERSLRMLEEAVTLIKAELEAGKPIDAIVDQSPLQKFSSEWSWGFINVETMTKQVIQGLK